MKKSFLIVIVLYGLNAIPILSENRSGNIASYQSLRIIANMSTPTAPIFEPLGLDL